MLTQLSHENITDGAALLQPAQIAPRLKVLQGWALVDEGRAIRREFPARSFLAAQSIASLIGGIAQLANHHPDIAYGWGYCRVTFSTHSAGGVTLNDLICAARVNLII